MSPGRRVLVAALLAGVVGLSGCASWSAHQTQALLTQRPADLPAAVEWDQVPFFPQTVNQCGPAALATALGAVGVSVPPEDLTRDVFLPAREGSLQIEMLAAVRRHGQVGTRIRPELHALLQEVAAGHAPVVLLNLGLSVAPLWHYAVVVGYDLPSGQILMRSGTTRRAWMPLATFEHTWKRSGQWAFVALPPEVLPVAADEDAVTEGRVAFERVAEPARAVEAYRVAWQRWPDSLVLALGRANSLYAAHDYPAAAQAYEQVARRHDSAAAWNNLAHVRLALGDVASALQAAEAAVRRAQTDRQWLPAAESTLATVQAAARSSRPPQPQAPGAAGAP